MLAVLPETLWAQECVSGASNGTFSNSVCVRLPRMSVRFPPEFVSSANSKV